MRRGSESQREQIKEKKELAKRRTQFGERGDRRLRKRGRGRGRRARKQPAKGEKVRKKINQAA